ncbi:MAG TPA: DUF2785 domain-containing protein [Vicinamibacterales bacterium]|nr:DUF2785 domain-containing protein [Vicinamibacterales bacterium]
MYACLVRTIAIAALVGATMPTESAGQPRATHDKAFWQSIAANKYAPPVGEPIEPLVRELSSLLGSPDPELRDDIAYSTLVSWIYRQKLVSVEQRRALVGEWIDNLSVGIGSTGSDDVLRRSFSALALGITAILDNEAPYLDRAEFDRMLQAALTYLAAEKDIRGFDAAKGWVHATAHTADLIKFLARSRYLEPARQKDVLTAISTRMGAVETVFTDGEDERLARAVLSIVARSDFDEAGFRAWVGTVGPVRPAGSPTRAEMARNQNRKNLVVALYAVLSTDARDLPGIRAARAIVLERMKTFM